MHMIHPDLLRSFVAVAETRSFSLAAQRLALGQSPSANTSNDWKRRFSAACSLATPMLFLRHPTETLC